MVGLRERSVYWHLNSCQRSPARRPKQSIEGSASSSQGNTAEKADDIRLVGDCISQEGRKGLGSVANLGRCDGWSRQFHDKCRSRIVVIMSFSASADARPAPWPHAYLTQSRSTSNRRGRLRHVQSTLDVSCASSAIFMQLCVRARHISNTQ